MSCCPIQFATFKTPTSLTLPAGLKSATVRNKGAGSVYVAGKELCPPATAPSSPCGNCAGESLTLDAGCGVYGQPISVNIPNGCAEISIEWSPNPLLDMTDSDGDGVPDWLEALNPCLALPEPDVTVNDLVGNPVGTQVTAFKPLQIRADCSLYENQIGAESRFVLLEEIDSTTKQPTGVLVQVETKPDGTLVYTNMATGAVYAAPAGTELVKEEDSDFELVRTLGCDAGSSIEKREWFKVGVAVAVVSAVVNVATGSAHALSGAETWGSYCVADSRFTEPNLICAKVRSAAAPAAIPAGTVTEKLYRVVEQNAVTGVPVATKFYKQSDNSEVMVGDAAGNYWVDDGCC
jgi:hypothetical protein